jgi:hypothetical protein
MPDKTLKIIVLISLVFSIISISACIFMYQNLGRNQIDQKIGNLASDVLKNLPNQPAEIVTGDNKSFDVKTPEKAGGFLGLPEIKDIKAEGDSKKIMLRGHWTVDNKPTFDFIGHPNYEEAATSLPLKGIILNNETKIKKFTIGSLPEGKYTLENETDIALGDLKVESLKDPIFAVFSQQTDTKENEVTAAGLAIFSGYSKLYEKIK